MVLQLGRLMSKRKLNLMLYRKDHIFPLPPSKSLLARRLVLEVLEGKGLSSYSQGEYKAFPEDIQKLYQALSSFLIEEQELCVGESGTAMRLMTAFLSFKVKQRTKLYGLGRQHLRPISALVDALRFLGAKIDYLEEDGFPPLLIKPSKLKPQKVHLDASKSSQYLSALLLLAPLVKEGNFSIDTRMYGLVSSPYAFMTMKVLREAGYHWQEENGLFSYLGKKSKEQGSELAEADWTSASYAYEICSMLGEGAKVSLPNLCLPSLQGDSKYLPSFFEQFGVSTQKTNNKTIVLSKEQEPKLKGIVTLDCSNCPDLVPTFVATCIIHARAFNFEGVAHLAIKESNRLEVLRRECAKVGAKLCIGLGTISWDGTYSTHPSSKPTLNPEGDHRMAMALAPMMSKFSQEGIMVETPEVVAKSFPNYWDNLSIFGYSVNKLD